MIVDVRWPSVSLGILMLLLLAACSPFPGWDEFFPSGENADVDQATAKVIEFFDDFESYPIGYNPAEVYDYDCDPWTSAPIVILPDLFEVGQISSNKVLQFSYENSLQHFPGFYKIIGSRFAEIHEFSVTFIFS